MTSRHFLSLVPILFIFGPLNAQELLTLEEAIQIGLEKNYDIKLVANELEIARNNATRANAGMLPELSGGFSNNGRTTTTIQTMQSGEERTFDNARNNTMNYGAQLSWQIFDGFRMFAEYDRLNELEKQGELNTRIQVQTTVADIISTYYDLVRQQKQLEATETALEVSRIRLGNAENRYQIGKASRLEVLAASVDLNTDTTNLMRQHEQYRNTQIRLNELLVANLEQEFAVIDTILVDETLLIDKLRDDLELQNPGIQVAAVNQKLAEFNYKATKADRFPQVEVGSGYDFTRSTSDAGFATRSRSNGVSYGITVSMNIFNGFLQNRNERNARIEMENAALEKERVAQNARAQLLSAYQTYLTGLELVKVEAANLTVAQENMNITLEKYNLGSIVPLELREAQRNFIDANARYTDAQYQAKLAEVALKEMTGNIPL